MGVTHPNIVRDKLMTHRFDAWHDSDNETKVAYEWTLSRGPSGSRSVWRSARRTEISRLKSFASYQYEVISIVSDRIILYSDAEMIK